ncbi:MAG: SGNH/GDSL hydrolase family protein [Nitrospiraceae bacterium]
MKPMTSTDGILVSALYICELAAVLWLLGFLHADRELGMRAILSSRTGVFTIVAGVIFSIGLVMIIIRYRNKVGTESRSAMLTIAMNIAATGALLVAGELVIRAAAERFPDGVFVRDLQLLPRQWKDVATDRRTRWEQASTDYGVYTFDRELGWTVGSNRQGQGPHGETYFSSIEGIRAPLSNVAFADRRPALRIALVGDSYTFSSDVSYANSWGQRLEARLGQDVQVLNFGVPGYGVDQAYLRYRRDVRPWQPDIVILGVINHDLIRTGMVYYCIGFAGAVVPGAKPRFVINDSELALINVPLPMPEQIFQSQSIRDLPYVDLDRWYKSSDWEQRWYHASYLVRFLASWSPSWLVSDSIRDQEIRSVSRTVLQAFVRSVRESGAVPLVLVLPGYGEFRDQPLLLKTPSVRGAEVLQEAGVEYVDLTACLENVHPSDRFTTGWHYTPLANDAVADCLETVLRRKLPGT